MNKAEKDGPEIKIETSCFVIVREDVEENKGVEDGLEIKIDASS